MMRLRKPKDDEAAKNVRIGVITERRRIVQHLEMQLCLIEGCRECETIEWVISEIEGMK